MKRAGGERGMKTRGYTRPEKNILAVIGVAELRAIGNAFILILLLLRWWIGFRGNICKVSWPIIIKSMIYDVAMESHIVNRG
jgi:hypothetical protein